MRILYTAYLHFERPFFDWIKSSASQYDLVCVAGDLSDIVLEDLHELSAPVAFALAKESRGAHQVRNLHWEPRSMGGILRSIRGRGRVCYRRWEE